MQNRSRHDLDDLRPIVVLISESLAQEREELVAHAGERIRWGNPTVAVWVHACLIGL